MWLPPKVLARLFVATAAVLTAIALSLGRYGPRPSDERRMVPPRYHPINMYLFHPGHTDLLMLDVDAGKTEHFPLADSHLLQYAGCSPWRDRRGRTHVVGLWTGRSSPGAESLRGLTRYAIPGREVLDRVEMDVLPASHPCWSPDTTARILFAGQDGHLYQYAFDDPRVLDPVADDKRRPRPLIWRTQPPVGLMAIAAPTWPADPRLGGKIVVSLTIALAGARAQPVLGCPSRTELWWLQLGPDGSAIVAAGPLLSKGAASSAKCMTVEDLPVISTIDDGRLLLAYLARRESEIGYRLRLAPIMIEGPSSVPSFDEVAAVEFPGKFLPNPPAFSGDGRWVYAVPRTAQELARIERFSVADALAGGPEHAAVSEPPPPPISTDGRPQTEPTASDPVPDRVGE